MMKIWMMKFHCHGYMMLPEDKCCHLFQIVIVLLDLLEERQFLTLKKAKYLKKKYYNISAQKCVQI